MMILSSVFFSLALILAVTVGPQTRPWTWGPSLIFLGLAVASAIPSLIRHKPKMNGALLVVAAMTTAWFTWRAAVSPVADLKTADLLLLGGTIGSFAAMTAVTASRTAEKIFLWTLSGLLISSVAIIARQVIDPGFHPIFASRPVTLPSGFFGHYNECANFLVGTAFLLGASALMGSYSTFTRLVWGLSAVAGLAAVYYTRSRGGILAVGVGVVAFGIVSILISKRRNSRGFPIAVIALPILFMAAIGWIYKGWTNAQTFRFQTGAETTDAASVIESSIRLHLFGIASRCVDLHPWGGGGSRSFSWECNQFWNSADHGTGHSRLEYVHNELLQSVTDYGILGGILLIVLLSWSSLGVIARSCSDWNSPRRSPIDALHIGGISGLAGMFAQSNFSFVFHLFPGVLLLGICLGRMVLQDERKDNKNSRQSIGQGILVASGIAVILASLWMGVRGTRVLFTLWTTYFSAPAETSPERNAAALAKALVIWPQSALYSDRSLALQKLSKQDQLPPSSDPNIHEAIADYREAIRLHPYDANLRTNLAGLLGLVGNEQAAEQEYTQAGILEGGLEAAYKAHFRFCGYLVKRGMMELGNNQLEAASQSFSLALEQFEKLTEKTPWMPNQQEGLKLKFSLLLGVGISYEAAGDFTGALENYDEVAKHHGGNMGNYRAALLLESMGETAWRERQPAKSLTLFQQAKQRLDATGELASAELEKKRTEHLSFVTRRIQYLLDAKIEPLQER